MSNRPLILAPLLACLALAGCLGNSGSPQPPPSDVQAYAGDAAVSVVWSDQHDISYWLFFAQNSDITPQAIAGSTTMLNVGVVDPAFSPTILCNGARFVVNNTPATDPNFPPLFFTIDARTGTAKGGPASPPVGVTPRPAASAGVPWIPGASIPAPVNGLGYVALSACGYASHPPQGMFVAVGPSAAIYTSALAPSVVGPLTNPGNVAMTWTQGIVPLGFGSNLNAVAGRAVGGVPAADSLLFAAVGDGGAILRSIDGYHWTQSAITPSADNLHDVAFAASVFVAVGDGGTILTSADGITWTLNTSAQLANPAGAALRAVHCVGATCLAVGDSGTALWSSSGGASWSAMPFGTNNWVAIAYGNADANRDAVTSYPNGVLQITTGNEFINTWIIVDGDGNYAYFNGATGGTWARGATAIAPGIVAIDYTSRFVALDSAGNAWASENGTTDAWSSQTAAPVASNGSAIAMRSNSLGFVALGSGGANAANF